MRILVTVKPRMYRESVALSLYQHYPDFEVVLGDIGFLDEQAESFRPHLLIRNDTDGVNMDRRTVALGWIEVLYSDGMDARISVDGEVWNIKDISIGDLLVIVDQVQQLILDGAVS